MEQMLIQSMVNIQLDGLKKNFKEVPIKAKSLLKRFPKELQCYGLKISDLDLSFKKSLLQLTAYQTPAEEVDEAMCDKFYKDLSLHQADLIENMGEGENPFTRGMRSF